MEYAMMRITIIFAILMQEIAVVQMQLCGFAMIVHVSGNKLLILFLLQDIQVIVLHIPE